MTTDALHGSITTPIPGLIKKANVSLLRLQGRTKLGPRTKSNALKESERVIAR